MPNRSIFIPNEFLDLKNFVFYVKIEDERGQTI